MISDLELAQACSDTYDDAAVWDQSWTRENIHVGLRHAGEVNIVAFRGSVDEQDWIRDFMGWPRKHPLLGYCHSGFLDGMDTVADELGMAVGARPVAFTGHSLGAARALIMAGIWAVQHRPVDVVVTFGTPRPGMAQLSHILNTGGFFIKHYRNGPDPVAEVPVSLAPLWLYQKPQPDTPLSVPPPEAYDPAHWHHMPLYLAGIQGMKP